MCYTLTMSTESRKRRRRQTVRQIRERWAALGESSEMELRLVPNQEWLEAQRNLRLATMVVFGFFAVLATILAVLATRGALPVNPWAGWGLACGLWYFAVRATWQAWQVRP